MRPTPIAAATDDDDERLYASLTSHGSPSSSAPRLLHHAAATSDVAYWAHEMSCSSLASTDSGYTQQPWLPDDLSSNCMRCRRPFHLLRWTHHCRDCGGVFCWSCTAHRVQAEASAGQRAVQGAPSIFRLCDGCAFGPQHASHIGCRNPITCPRCARPRTATQCMVYLEQAFRMLACCGVCCASETCWCLGSGCVASLDAERRSRPSRGPTPRARRCAQRSSA